MVTKHFLFSDFYGQNVQWKLIGTETLVINIQPKKKKCIQI